MLGLLQCEDVIRILGGHLTVVRISLHNKENI